MNPITTSTIRPSVPISTPSPVTAAAPQSVRFSDPGAHQPPSVSTILARLAPPTASLSQASIASALARLSAPRGLTGDPLIDALGTCARASSESATSQIDGVKVRQNEKEHQEALRLKQVMDVIKAQEDKGFWDKLQDIVTWVAAICAAASSICSAGAGLVASGYMLTGALGSLAGSALVAAAPLAAPAAALNAVALLSKAGVQIGSTLVNNALTERNIAEKKTETCIEQTQRSIDLAKASIGEHFEREGRVISHLRQALDTRHAAVQASIHA